MNLVSLLTEKDPGDLDLGAHVIVMRRQPSGNLEILVGFKRGKLPEETHDLPGGHLRTGEDPAEAAARELKEETGIALAPEALAYLGSMGQLFFFAAEVPSDTPVHARSDEDELKWVAPEELRTSVLIPPALIHAALAINEAKASLARPRTLVESRRGLLIAFEGPDGSGKSTQHRRLQQWLESNRQPVVATKWNSSARIAPIIRQAKEDQSLSPLLFSLLHAADLVERYETIIAPALQEGRTVLCDRYYYTSLVRDSIRGIDESALLNLYRDLRVPDIVFHCCVPVDVAFTRLTERQGSLNYYAAGMDLKLSENMHESCRRYLGLMDAAYRRILPPLLKQAYHRLNTGRLISEIAAEVQHVVGDKLYAHTLVTQLIG